MSTDRWPRGKWTGRDGKPETTVGQAEARRGGGGGSKVGRTWLQGIKWHSPAPSSDDRCGGLVVG